MKRKEAKFSDLIGKTIAYTKGLEVGSDSVLFMMTDGSRFEMEHSQSCCESVRLEDIAGDVRDLIGFEILEAEEVTSDENPEGVTPEYQDSFTWTFYKLATFKGRVTIRWYGHSNGYYSERVDFFEHAQQ